MPNCSTKRRRSGSATTASGGITCASPPRTKSHQYMKARATTSPPTTAQNCQVANAAPGSTGALPPGLSSMPLKTMYAMRACAPTTMR